MCFAPVMSRAGKFHGAEAAKGVLSKKLDVMKQYLKEAEKKAEQDYQKVQEQNRAYRRLLKEERFEEAEELFRKPASSGTETACKLQKRTGYVCTHRLVRKRTLST